MNDHEDIRSLLPGHALGALDPEEEERVRAHLRGCARCRRELDEYVRAGDALLLSVGEAEPPQALEERLMRSVRAMRPIRRRPLLANPFAAAAAAVLIIVLAAGNVAQWINSPGFQARTRGLVTIALVGAGGNREAYGTIVVDMDDSEGVLAVRGLSPLEPSLRYQLWLVRDDKKTSGGSFAVNQNGYGSLLIKVPGGFRSFQRFCISVEPAEGSPAPTRPPILIGNL